MTKICKLNDITKYENAVLYKLENKGDIRGRLQDLGLIEGTQIKFVQKSPLGDPTAYEIRGAIIALRSDDAQKIFVTVGSDQNG
ncbi:MAG: FeoA family protein [Clostridia bacterium]